MKRIVPVFVSLVFVAAVALTGDDEKTADHGFVSPADVRWGPAPPALPAGAKMAVLEGNPAEEGLFTIRLSTPAGYKIAPHWHPAYEHLTVISGEAKMSLGDTCDAGRAHKLGPGAFGWMKPGTHHCLVTEIESVVQIHAFGPWQLYYVNPADDPRQTAGK